MSDPIGYDGRYVRELCIKCGMATPCSCDIRRIRVKQHRLPAWVVKLLAQAHYAWGDEDAARFKSWIESLMAK